MNKILITRLSASLLVYRILNKSSKINGVVKRITGGGITRNNLAKRIISDSVSICQQYGINTKFFGNRSAEIINQSRSVLFSNTQEQVNNGLTSLVNLLLNSRGPNTEGCINNVAMGITKMLGPNLKDHALERVLVALTKYENGENVLKLALDNGFSGIFGGKIISSTLMSALKRAILNRPEYRDTNILHSGAAWKLYEFLESDPSKLPPKPILNETISTISNVTSVISNLDSIYDYLQLPYREQKLSSVFNNECWPMNLEIKEDISHKHFAKIIMMAYASNQGCVVDKNIDALPSGIRQILQEEKKSIRDFLSRVTGSEIKVAQNWHGDIESISIEKSIFYNSFSQLQMFIDNEFLIQDHNHEEVAHLFTDGEFIKSPTAGINLRINNNHLSYVRWITDMGNQFVAQAQNSWSGQTDQIKLKKLQLEKLSYMVDNNPNNLLILSKYLISEKMNKSFEKLLFNQFTHQKPDLICVENIWMKVGKPEVSFEVSRQQGIDVDIFLRWPIEKFGPSIGELSPPNIQLQQNHISHKINVNILFNEDGLEKQKIKILNTEIKLQDRMMFPEIVSDTEIPTERFLNLNILKKLCMM
ncbi:hypothetical protein [Candidatus Arsenophonus triatominarum]|uniref:hypothetical protein n=1 Tax=Candidatus Arsenophonus triatominarum TaxID=57911 RepID=UPI0007C4ED63|nr:hypothetical protein [Candidatus Arsenophonus triatominarum]